MCERSQIEWKWSELTAPGRKSFLDSAPFALAVVFLWLLPVQCHAQKFYTYIGDIGTDSVLLAWGTTGGRGNTIGRTSVSLGKATVRIGDQEIFSEHNWVLVRGLLPDTAYSYEVSVGEKRSGAGTVRTYPEKSDKLAFFVQGDYGTGTPPQYEVAEAMGREFDKRRRSDNPVRFVLTTGDNVYSDRILGVFETESGNQDSDWGPRFFEPYQRLLKQIPFYPSPGNHDGNGADSKGHRSAYLDNFFLPSLGQSRYYAFSFGGLADFFALDTGSRARDDSPAASLADGGQQFQWLQQSLAGAKAPWKIAYFHHPPFNAGPGHGASLPALRPVVDLFRKTGVQVVFNGHEHNFQYSRRNATTGNVLYVITGAGGNVRTKDVRNNLEESNIAGWAGQHHFLLVEIEDQIMRITPLGAKPVLVRDRNGNAIPMPIVVRRSD